MVKRFAILALLFILMLASCDQLPADDADQDTLATTVSATLAAAASEDNSTVTPMPETTEKTPITSTPESQTQPEPTLQDFLLAYTNDGNLWTLSPGGDTRQLNSSGDVVAVLISDDRSLIVYVRQSFQPDLFEVRAINADGTNDRQVLSQDTLDSLYPLDGALHYVTSQLDFIPSTHLLIFNTRAVFDGPGLVKNDDLHQLDVDSGKLSQLIPRERGGDFSISPDGQKLAISKADSIAIASIDGTNLRTDLVTFQPIITYSEYQYYPLPVWSPDSTRFGVFIPSSDPLAENPDGTVWLVPVEGSPRSFPAIPGQAFFPQSNNRSLLSPDLQTVALLRGGNQGEEGMLYLANLDGTNSRMYAQGDLQWLGWNPEGNRFAFLRGEARLTLGNPHSSPQPLPEGRSLRWLTNELFMVQSGQRGDWKLTLGHIDGTKRDLVQPAGDAPTYDLR